MGVKSRIRGGIMAVIGYILSPLSWWNDAVINLPIAWLFASLVALLSHRLFAPAMLLGYWLTNVAGLVLLARGAARVATGDDPQKLKRRLAWSFVAATGYTAVVVILFLLGLLRPLDHLLLR
jgi:hypothetical protein